MKRVMPVVAVLTNLLALFCVFNPWGTDWVSQGIVFLAVEMAALAFIGVPVFIHHLRKGLSPGQALSASLDTVMNFMSGWV